MSLITIVQVIFLLIGILWVLQCFLPNWQPPVVITAASVTRCLIGIVVLVLVYILVTLALGYVVR